MSVTFSNDYGAFVLGVIALTLVLLFITLHRLLNRRLMVWVAKHRGTKHGALIGCSSFLAMGSFPAYQVIVGLINGEQMCAFLHCTQTLYLAQDQERFWASLAIWLFWVLLCFGAGLYGFYLVLAKNRYAP